MKRVASLDLLRVICMYLIVMVHFIYHGIKGNNISFNVLQLKGILEYSLFEVLYLISCIGVDCFVLISGYFLIERSKFRLASLIKLWFLVAFYSNLLYIISCLIGIAEFSIKVLLSFSFPIISNRYWFISQYFALMLLAPFLSYSAKILNKKAYLLLLLLFFVICFQYPYGHIYTNGESILWFLFLYLVAGYIKLYGVPNYISKRLEWVIIAFLCFLFAMVTFVNLVKGDFNAFLLMSTDYNGLIFVLAVLVFMLFLNKSFDGLIIERVIRIAPHVVAAYLISDHKVIRRWLWSDCFNSISDYSLILSALFLPISIFVVCIFIDYIRSLLFALCRVEIFANKISRFVENRIALIGNHFLFI
jgi:surface polysaccharide O-acyltransferase-like enzyme